MIYLFNLFIRHRKQNLYEEPLFQPGQNLTVFETDFGVKFGMFICADILYKNPATDVVDGTGVSDVIFSTAWFSELPFFHCKYGTAS